MRFFSASISKSLLFFFQNVDHGLFRADHARRGDAPHIAHRFLGRCGADAMRRGNIDPAQRQSDRLKGRVYRDDALHHAALIAAVADHAGDARRQIAE